MAAEPVFTHDACDGCVYLGPFGTEAAVEFDLWFCSQGGSFPTVIARFGDDGADYHSGIHSQIDPLVEAKRRAVSRGLLTEART